MEQYISTRNERAQEATTQMGYYRQSDVKPIYVERLGWKRLGRISSCWLR